ncbi:MAG: transglycosylase SLT domain-containing protein [Solirubrobacterales bacterium]
MSPGRLIACTALGDARGADAVAAAVAVCATPVRAGLESALVLDLRRSAGTPRGALLASTGARELEAVIRERTGMQAAARGRICFARAAVGKDADLAGSLGDLLEPLPARVVACVCDPVDFRSALAITPAVSPAALLRAVPGADRSLIALLAAELRAERIPLKAWTAPFGLIPTRRSLAGLEPGGTSSRRATRFANALAPTWGRSADLGWARGTLASERAQALPAVLGVAVLVVAFALILIAIGGAATAKGRLQRSADLAALSAARSMRDDLPRLFLPARRPNGELNPAHLDRDAYLARAEAEARTAAERNGTAPELVALGFPDAESMAPLRVRVRVTARVTTASGGDGAATSVAAEAEVTPPTAPAPPSQPTVATGGGYGGSLAYRQGRPMRPDVAAAFDRMAAAARADGLSLVINSAFRSDAEQQALWDANPDPTWVAPPGTSLHRCGTELDLGPPEAYGWLSDNGSRFDFVQRYSWEAWHYGFAGGPPPCSAEGDHVSTATADGKSAGEQGLPSFVPGRYRRALLDSAARNDVSAALLAAQLMAESNFNPNAVSAVGALGIAQFMPATADAYGLDDPFDPIASIEAQARMMGELMKQFGSVELALAAYNAGPGAVAACGCVPHYPETQAYVVRIMGLLEGAGELTVPAGTLEVRLVG